jgi:Na+-translocating ferredoxin:NAD+ oxidoreductase subunit C
MLELFKFKGGVKPAYHKEQSVDLPIAAAPLPSHVVIPLHQSIGGTPQPLVAVGDHVLKGQPIGAADGWISAAVHASTSGTVVAVGPVLATHPSGLMTDCVTIVPDGEDRWIERTPFDYRNAGPDATRAYLQQSGVVGLGGAVFPSHAKLAPARSVAMEELVLNGAECEPYITCDDLLMRERAAGIVAGAGIFRDLMQPRRVLIGIEDNKPAAIAAMQAAVTAAGEPFEVIAVPTRYPAGGAKQLIRVLTGKEIPASKRSTDLGVQCFNVATAYTAWRAIAYGEPVVTRIATITGNIEVSRNWEVAIGTPMNELLALGAPRADTDGIIMGGPMMGFLVPAPEVPVIKATNCLIAHSPTLFPSPPPEMPCIRCGECARACPHELQPFEMYWQARAKNFGKAQEYKLFDCIECGCCAYVCPAHIPLVQYFRFAKSEIWARERERKAADGAKERFEFRQFREDREKAEKAEKLVRAAAAQAAKKAAEEAAGDDVAAPATPVDDAEATRKAAITAALERARAQRATVQPRNTEQLTPQQQHEVAAIDTRRTQAGLEVAAPDKEN